MKYNARIKKWIMLGFFLLAVLFIDTKLEIKAANGFVIRNSPPPSDSIYYSGSNGYTGKAMPNCTAYVYGRLYELLGYKPDISHNNAHTIYTTNESNGRYAYSSDPYSPKLGAIVCFAGGPGHVAIVEEIGSDSEGSYICVSESNYSGREVGKEYHAFNYVKYYLSELSGYTTSEGQHAIRMQYLEDYDGYTEPKNNDGRYAIVNSIFQGYVYAYPENITSEFPLVDGGIYKIRNALSGKLITVPNLQADDGIELLLWEDVTSAAQQWRAVLHSDGYSFVSVQTGKAFDIAAGLATPGVSLYQSTYYGTENQKFKLVHRGNGKYSIHPACSNLALDLYASVLDNGGLVQQYAYHGGDNQLWNIEIADITAPVISNAYITDVTEDGYTVVCDVTDSSKIARVCFPSWTEQNGMDDLDDNWYDLTAVTEPVIGTSNTYCFRVNVADHNNETGVYNTYIYAYDVEGNRSECCWVNTTINREIPLTDFTLSATSLLLDKQETQTLSITTYTPSNTTADKTAAWRTSDENVALVDGSGTVTGVGEGSATITCTIAGISKTCSVTVESAGETISGSVTSYLDAAGLIEITLLENDTIVHETTTTTDIYVIGNVKMGVYTMIVSKENHVTRSYAITVTDGAVVQDVKICPLGDVTQDGKVNTMDVSRAYAHVKNIKLLTDYALECGNVTGTAVSVNTMDVSRKYAHVRNTNPLW